jgi:predicted NBD/HSP70 family sugar kinase
MIGKKATHQQTKEHNRNLVLKTIFDHQSISRAEIARLTSLTRTTVSDLVAGLLEEGLVSEVGLGESQGGKSPILLSLVEDSRCLIGLDLAQSQFTGAVVNLRGKIHTRLSLPISQTEDVNGEEALKLVYEILDQLVTAACQPAVGIGVGAPGLINTSLGTVVNAVNLDWQNLPLARLLEDRYRLPTYILNDSQAAAMGEFTFGNGSHFQDQPGTASESNLLVINARQGIGAGIVINGRLFQGDGGGAGEIGHVVVVRDNGLPCRCGNHGCLETVASTQAIIKRVKALQENNTVYFSESSRPKPNLESIRNLFLAGDPDIHQIVMDTAYYMGIAIASLVGSFNIHHIVLTGDMTGFGEPWLEAIHQTIARHTLPRLAQDTQVEIGRLGGNGILLGASALLANNFSLLFKR